MTESNFAAKDWRRVIVVTGATRGLGRGTALALAARGHIVAVSACDAGETEQAALQLAARAPAGRVAGFAADVRDADQVESLARAVSAELGSIDVWINNAGLALTGQSLTSLDPADFALMVDINLLGTMIGCRSAARAMAGRGGAIYNIYGAGSDGLPVPGMIGYATTKRAVQFMTMAFASELAGGPLIVGGISPGLILTEGFFREHAKTPESMRTAREAVVNILADPVATIAEWVADIVLDNRENGREFAWLDSGKLDARRAEKPPRDVLAVYRDADGRLSARPEA